MDDRKLDKGPGAFRTISEVAVGLNVPQHVLRFWESRFTQIKPLKRGGGRRFYRPADVALIAGIQQLLYGSGYTIRGVQRILKEQGGVHVQAIGAARLPPSLALPDSAFVEDVAQEESVDDSMLLSESVGESDDLGQHEVEHDDFFFSPETAPEHDEPFIPENNFPAADAIAAPLPSGPGYSNYAPGPLSKRPATARPPGQDIPQPLSSRYLLPSHTREQLQAILVEMRECRRLLGSVRTPTSG